MRRFLFIFSIILLCAGSVARADSSDSYGSVADYLDSVYGLDDNAGLTAFPVLNVPMGGRSEGLASAFTAVADDISFIEYNPAGSSMLVRTETAFFHNNWIADTKVEGAVFASRRGNFGFSAGGKWLYSPFTEYNLYGESVSKGYYSEAVAILNASYNFFSGYYFSGISIGINAKGAFRFVPDYADADDKVIAGSGRSQSAAMAMADIGALTRFDLLKFYKSRERNTSAALVVRNLGPPALDDPLPTVICAALAYQPLKPLLFSFDFSLPLNMTEPALSEKPYFAIGAAINIAEFLSMRTGVLIKAGSTRLTVGSAVNMEKISLDINYTLDLLTQLQPLNRISIGVRFDMGDQGRKAVAERVNSLYLSGLDDYSAGNYADARSRWEEALRLNPRFDPARESLKTLSNLEAVEQRIDNMQRLKF
jgi:tetratricopeptide (TPR) repeat protein